MDSYAAYTYPDSGESSPRSRAETDYENPPHSWDDQPSLPLPPTYKVKFMVSYGGKIQPRTHDNVLAYVGGDTKILAVDRGTKFAPLMSKLIALIISPDDAAPPSLASFKYQLPGEDLDALISVTNDDDLEHMMHEYDRLYRTSPRPSKLRLFLFPGTGQEHDQVVQGQGQGQPAGTGFGSGKLDRDRFVEAVINSMPQVPVPIQVQDPNPLPIPAPVIVTGAGDGRINNNNNHNHNHNNNNVDFLFGLENKPSNPGLVHMSKPVPAHDPDIEARVQELARMQINAQERERERIEMYRNKSDENLAGAFAADGYLRQPPSNIPAGYWQPPSEQQLQQQQFHHQAPPPAQPQMPPPQQQPQQVYMVHAPPQPTSVYHAPPLGRPVTGQPTTQGYYQVQRVAPDHVYRDQQPVYNVPTPAPSVPMQMPRQVENTSPNGGYHHQVAYDNGSGRQVYYAAPGGPGVGVVTAPYQGMPAGVAVSGAADVKVVPKVSPTSAAG